MTDYPIRYFADDAAVARTGAGLLDHTLPRADWTHEAHLGAISWLVRCRSDIDLDAEIDAIIASYNVAAGGVNDDSGGYHDTITRTYLAGIRAHLDRHVALFVAVNRLLKSPVGARDWPLAFYSPERLFSVAARRGFVTPDIAPLP